MVLRFFPRYELLQFGVWEKIKEHMNRKKNLVTEIPFVDKIHAIVDIKIQQHYNYRFVIFNG